MSLLAAGALLLSGGAAVAGGLLKDKAAKKQAKAENKELQRNAQALREQAGIYGSMAKSQLRAASGYAKQAKGAEAIGKYNSRNLRLASARLDLFEQFALYEAKRDARMRVGEGRASFAANGVLVDSGSSALWEQDEAADAALEQLDIMQQFKEQRWQNDVQATLALAEGYGSAAGYFGGAAGAAGDAYASRLQQAAALSQAQTLASTRIKSGGYQNTLGAVLGFASSFGLSRL